MWSVIGALSQACPLPVTTAVTCPTVRTHPVVIAQAAATSARANMGPHYRDMIAAYGREVLPELRGISG